MLPDIWLLATVGLVIGLAGALLALGLLIGLTGGDEMSARIHHYAEIPKIRAPRNPSRGLGGLERFRLQLNETLAALASDSLNLQLARANWRITVPEFLLIRVGVTALGFLVGWALFRSLLSGAGLALLAYLVQGIVLQRGISQRQSQFSRQLPDMLVMINGAVRAGHSLLQALETVMREMKPPASEEFARVVREVGLGLRLSDAMRNLAVRMQNPDLELLVSAIDIQYQVGGNLATMLAAVTETMRDRTRLLGEVRVLTTQQRYSSYLLSVLPFFIAGFLFLLNPTYMRRLFEPQILCIPIGALAGVLAGGLFIRRLSRIEV